MKNSLLKFLFLIRHHLDRVSRGYEQKNMIRNGLLKIGRGTYGCPKVYQFKGSESLVDIGRYTSIAPNVTIIAGGIHPVNAVTQFPIRSVLDMKNKYGDGNPYSNGPVVIGSDVWISSGATILSGVKIGHGAIIGANSLVTRNIPPYGIAYGSPAKVVKFRFTPIQISSLLKIQWWNWSESKIAENVDLLTDDDINLFLERFN